MNYNIDDILDKFSNTTLNNLDKDNIKKIIHFLQSENCKCIEDIIEDYLDVFTIEYKIFIQKYNKLNKKYHERYLQLVTEDMNFLEELFND